MPDPDERSLRVLPGSAQGVPVWGPVAMPMPQATFEHLFSVFRPGGSFARGDLVRYLPPASAKSEKGTKVHQWLELQSKIVWKKKKTDLHW